jgi:hypothetical protein
MKLKELSVGVLFLAGLLPSGAVTLEELASRMDKMEEKLQAYEARFGPLEESATPGVVAGPPQPSSYNSPKGGLPVASGAEVLDASYGVGGGGYSGGSSWFENTTLGGYGEMHLNLGDKEQIDFHRWVLFLSHRFNDRISLHSELEVEHSLAGDGKNGEVEIEQAYIEMQLGRGMQAKAGLFLLPVGIINETHEPTTFFGTERNPIESEIIPSTWWEGGIGLSQTLENGLSWDVAVHSGLNVPTMGSDAYRIRSGRQKVSEAPAMEPAVTGRLRYTGVPGLDVSVFGQFQNDITQMAGTEDNAAVFWGAAASYQRGGFGLRGLYGAWDIDGDSVAMMDLDSQYGYYIEPSYTWTLDQGNRVGVFGRYNHYDAAKGDLAQYDLGLNYWPIDNVVFKADYSHIDQDGKDTEDIFNFGVGYSF